MMTSTRPLCNLPIAPHGPQPRTDVAPNQPIKATVDKGYGLIRASTSFAQVPSPLTSVLWHGGFAHNSAKIITNNKCIKGLCSIDDGRRYIHVYKLLV